jgi:ATP-dependent exoDNAse (exonuclease V) beta subunit
VDEAGDERTSRPARGLEEAPWKSARRGDGQAEAARRRGIATHRVLELLDLQRCGSAGAIDEQIEEMVARGKLAPEEAAEADMAGLRWFLPESPAGERLIAAARRIGTGQCDVRICREIPFTWSAPMAGAARSDDPADWPTVRGVIDVLIADRAARTAEILDYKTDSDFFWERTVEEYRLQMRYYLRAAADILGFPVRQATLIFLSPRREVSVSGDS